MTLLDRLLGHDLATTRDLLRRCRDLTDDQMDQRFDVGWETLRTLFAHMIGNIEVWTDLMMERPVQRKEDVSVSGLLARLERGYQDFADFARSMEREGRLDDLWTDVLDDPPVQKSFGGAIAHVITHNMHHRAEALHIMARLGMDDLPEGDLIGWDQRTRLG